MRVESSYKTKYCALWNAEIKEVSTPPSSKQLNYCLFVVVHLTVLHLTSEMNN